MARNEMVTFPATDVWTELTDSEDAAGVVAIQNRGPYPITVFATTDGTAPEASVRAGWVYEAGEADARTLAEMFPGVDTPVRLWARGRVGGPVMVSYA